MSRTVSLGADFLAHVSGALWIASAETLIVADLHLGYSWAQRRRGELGPLADEQTKQKLLAVVEEFRPREIVFLGDVVHAPRPAALEREWIEQLLSGLAERSRLTLVRGNHDRAFGVEFGHLPVEVAQAWQTGNVTAIHGDRFDVAVPEGHRFISGHVHPSLSIHDAAGASQRVPLFLHNAKSILLPAFSPFARGFNVVMGLPPVLQECFGVEPIHAVALSGQRAIPLGALDRAIEKLYAADQGAASRFRGAGKR